MCVCVCVEVWKCVLKLGGGRCMCKGNLQIQRV